MRIPEMKPVAAAAVVGGVLLLAQLVMIVGIQTALPVLPEPAGGRPFLIQRIPNGTTLSQLVNVRSQGLDTIELSGTVAGQAQSGSIDATLVELSADATEREVRAVTLTVSGTCCTIAFEPLRDSAGGRYRLNLKIRDFEASAPLSLSAALMERGGLTINGRPQAARLAFSGSTPKITAVARQRSISAQGRLSFGGFLALLILLDSAIAYGTAGLAKVFATEPAR